jgi:hypothetical protein
MQMGTHLSNMADLAYDFAEFRLCTREKGRSGVIDPNNRRSLIKREL